MHSNETLLNASRQDGRFRDGRAEDLVEQARGPILNPIEMACPPERQYFVICNIKQEEYP